MNNKKNDSIRIVVGCWNDYNECNERALGSRWLDLADFDDVEELKKELKTEGFDLVNGEFFIQDLEGISREGINCDYYDPFKFFEIIKESEILDDFYKLETADAFINVYSYNEFAKLVDRYGSHWDNDVYFYPNKTPAEVEEALFYDCGYDEYIDDLPDFIRHFISIDFEKMANEANIYTEVNGGTLEYY